MLFNKSTYIERRRRLRQLVGHGLIVLFGNNESPMNCPANTYKFRQDSAFLYFYGQHRDGLAAIIDVEENTETLFGNDIDIDDIVWFGSVTSVSEMAQECGVAQSAPMDALAQVLQKAQHQGRQIHFLPPYRFDTQIQIMDLLHIAPQQQKDAASLELIQAVVALRSVKSEEEIAELDRAAAIGYKMHSTAMQLCRPGVTEQYIGGILDGIAAAHGSITSFQSIVSMHGEILHGYPSTAPLEAGRLLLCDAGAETNEHYCSDNTRTTPISGKFDSRQKDIYQIVVDCHDLALSQVKPGVRYWDTHYAVCRLMTERLQQLGLMKGDIDASLQAGAHALFLPHGLGHMMGMDVHDMEGLGQTNVGFDKETRPNLDQFGINALRFGRRLEEGFVVTDEPGIYFIPALIDDWRQQGHNAQFINFDKVDTYKDFGGIRIEDDILVTKDGCRFLGKDCVPYHVEDVERFLEEREPLILQ